MKNVKVTQNNHNKNVHFYYSSHHQYHHLYFSVEVPRVCDLPKISFLEQAQVKTQAQVS